MFEPTSRYHDVETATLTLRDAQDRERPVPYLKRRFPASAEAATVVVEHTVVAGDRLDLRAARYLGDPTQSWRLCDANGAFRPEELEEVGRVIVIALPDR
jgi:nucleoid-associated protein YgaU